MMKNCEYCQQPLENTHARIKYHSVCGYRVMLARSNAYAKLHPDKRRKRNQLTDTLPSGE